MAGCCCMPGTCGRSAKGDSGSCMTVCSKCGMPKGDCKCGAAMARLPEVGTTALKTMMDAGVAMVLVDARTGKYDDGRRIPGAVSLSPEATEQEIQRVLKSRDALVASYCANPKCPTSRALAVRLQGLEYKHVLEYSHGIEGWTKAGYAVTPASK